MIKHSFFGGGFKRDRGTDIIKEIPKDESKKLETIFLNDIDEGQMTQEKGRIFVAMMMALLKIARTKTGSPNKDDLIDGAAYLAIAGELRFDD